MGLKDNLNRIVNPVEAFNLSLRFIQNYSRFEATFLCDQVQSLVGGWLLLYWLNVWHEDKNLLIIEGQVIHSSLN